MGNARTLQIPAKVHAEIEGRRADGVFTFGELGLMDKDPDKCSERELRAIVKHLDNAVEKLTSENKALKDGSCRFNCRSERAAFMAGAMADIQPQESKAAYIMAASEAYKAWRNQLAATEQGEVNGHQ